MKIAEICNQEECGHIEFKSEWYWSLERNDGERFDITRNWGEFIKDFLALVNSNLDSFGKKRHLIIGYDENDKKFNDFDLDESSFKKLERGINSKLSKFISDFENIDFKFYLRLANGANIIHFEINQPFKLHFLKNDIQTQSTDYKVNTVLCRGNNGNLSNKNDNVDVMSLLQIKKIEKKMEEAFSTQFLPLQPNQNKTIKNTVISYLEKNDTFRISDNFPIEGKDSKKYYELYELINKINGEKTYFSYIGSTNLKNSIEELFKEFQTINQNQGSLVLLIDKPNGTSPKTRMDYVRNRIKSIYSREVNIDFIDDFGREHLYKKYLEPFAFTEDFPNTKNFIENYSASIDDENNDILASHVLKKWFEMENNPVVVLTGAGGVGKTTIARNFLNKTLKEFKYINEHYVLFLDSSFLLDQLKSDRVSTIYDLYKADSSDSNYFTEELFKLSIDNGSFIIVLDGLDEIISGISIKFQLQYFLKNIFDDYCFNLARTKIIITCRDSIWEEASYLIPSEFDIEKIVIKPFNQSQAEKFFESCFKNENKLQKKSMSIVENLLLRSNESYYSPFMLDTISELVKSDINKDSISNIFDIEDQESSELCFIRSSMLDYLVHAVCKREVKKLNISLINQVNILCKISEKKQVISKSEFILIVNNIIENPDNKTVSLLLAHPFINFNSKDSIGIRYDFLRDFFLKISISQRFYSGDILEESILLLLLSKVSYLNYFSLDIGSRLSDLDISDIHFFVLQNIEDIVQSKNSNYEIYISSLFILYLGILKSKQKLENTQHLNDALLEIFSNSDKNKLENISLCNIKNMQASPKPLFDFSNLTIDNCYIDNYPGFVSCNFNEHTLFNTGTINIDHSDHAGSQIKPYHFSNQIIKLGKTSDVLDLIESSLEKSSIKKEERLAKFIRLFIKNGRFMPKKTVEVKSKRGGNEVKNMLSNNIILINTASKLNQEEYIVNPDYKDMFHKFCDNGVTTPQLKTIIDSL